MGKPKTKSKSKLKWKKPNRLKNCLWSFGRSVMHFFFFHHMITLNIKWIKYRLTDFTHRQRLWSMKIENNSNQKHIWFIIIIKIWNNYSFFHWIRKFLSVCIVFLKIYFWFFFLLLKFTWKIPANDIPC